MKLLLFSDLHEHTAAAHTLVARAAHVDVLVGAGDIGNLRRGIEGCIEILREAGKPTILVPGNNESDEELRAACRSWPQATVLHGASTMVAGVTFFGLGGGVPVTPFGAWSWDFTEEQAARLLSACPAGCVLITHSPPRGTVDRSSRGESLGSVAVRDAIVRTRPRLVVCGHIHGSAGQTSHIGSSPVVNAGPQGVEWTLSDVTPDTPQEPVRTRSWLHRLRGS